ncbi:MAG: hypothetical protein ABJB05_08055 [Parafilimonas sp.]
MAELKSEGKCLFCGETFLKAGINRHLQKHLAAKAKENKPGKSFLLKIETNPQWGSSPYFLSLWADGEALMGDIDNFLRRIWLECCGHMSSFTNEKNKQKGGGMWDFFEAEQLLAKGKRADYEKLMEDANGEIPMSREIKTDLAKNLKIKYDYDFGSITSLQLTVVEEYPVKADAKIVLLSRNEPLEILCETCGKEPATVLCSVCMGNEESAFCKKCGKQHAKTCSDFKDYAAMPVVNSPRMGVCAYEGGSIDTKRDGVFAKQKQ